MNKGFEVATECEKLAWTGKTVEVIERNGCDDSDFFATYFDGENFVQKLCGTTRYAFPISATVDASEEILKLWQAEKVKRAADAQEKREQVESINPTVGKRVLVTEGRKYKGVEGQIFWRGVNKYKTFYKGGYSNPEALHNQVVGIATASGEKFFVSASYVTVIF